MGFYQAHLAPRFVDTMCSKSGLEKWRARCVDELAGTVIEVGFGAGRNVHLYPPSVSEIVAIEPSPVMRSRATKQIEKTEIPFRWGGLDGSSLQLDDNSCDAGVITFALCTIPQPVNALRELRRVIRPGGELRVLEHGIAPDHRIRRWQHRLNPIEKRMADGCSLVHDPVASLEESGWIVTNVYQRYTPGPKPWCYLSSLRAV